MIITIKLSSFGFNISDGQYKKALASNHSENMKITHYPTWIEYFGWVYFFGGFLAGPTCEYMDYSRFIHDKTPRHTLRPALCEVAKSLFFIAALVYFAPTFNYFEALKPEWSATSFAYK
jgi:lysophospholipid acyltransferase